MSTFAVAVSEVERLGARRAQNYDEALALVQHLKEHDAGGVYLEVGARHGWTFFVMAQCIDFGQMIAVDLPAVYPWGDEGSAEILQKVGERCCGTIVWGDSREQKTIKTVEAWLDGNTVDVLFIDGDHKYEGVRADWDNYKQFLSPHAAVIFHDIAPIHRPGREKQKIIEVDKLWRELSPKYDYEVIDKGVGMGLGILHL